jgi:hypothetical protein
MVGKVVLVVFRPELVTRSSVHCKSSALKKYEYEAYITFQTTHYSIIKICMKKAQGI